MSFTHTQHWSDFTGGEPQSGPEKESHGTVSFLCKLRVMSFSDKTQDLLLLSTSKLRNLMRPEVVQESICLQDN